MSNKTKTARARAMYCSKGHYAAPIVHCFDKSRISPPWHEPCDAKRFFPVAVIPCPTAKQARQIVKAAPFLTMTEEEQVERLAKDMYAAIKHASHPEWDGLAETGHIVFHDQARAVLAAINGGGR